VSAGHRFLFGSPSKAVRAGARNGLHAARNDSPLQGGQLQDRACRDVARRSRLIGVSSGVVPNGARGIRRPTRLRAIVLPGRRQLWLVTWSAARGVHRAAPWSGKHRVVLAGGTGGDGASGTRGKLVQGKRRDECRATRGLLATERRLFTSGRDGDRHPAGAPVLEVRISGEPRQLLHVLLDQPLRAVG